jgi:hypothetical protein
MASWLDAFVQGRESGSSSTLGGLEAGAMGKYRAESEQGQRQRAYEANRLTAADMGLRRNIAQTQLNYQAEVDRENAERQRRALELDAARNATLASQAAVQNRLGQMDVAKQESMQNLLTSLYDPRSTASDIIKAIPLAGLENIRSAKPELAEFLSTKLGGDVLVKQGGAYRFIKPESGMVDVGGEMMDANQLESVLRTLGIETGILPGMETKERGPSFLDSLTNYGSAGEMMGVRQF